MYHQIAHNKRVSVIVIAAFVAVWIVAGFVIGGLFGRSWGTLRLSMPPFFMFPLDSKLKRNCVSRSD